MMTSRVGRFFLLIGLLSVIVFLATNQASNPQYGFLCWGTPGVFLGLYLMSRGQKKSQPSMRFRLFRKKRKNKASNLERSQDEISNDEESNQA
jgi:Na+/phosphate symporter